MSHLVLQTQTFTGSHTTVHLTMECWVSLNISEPRDLSLARSLSSILHVLCALHEVYAWVALLLAPWPHLSSPGSEPCGAAAISYMTHCRILLSSPWKIGNVWTPAHTSPCINNVCNKVWCLALSGSMDSWLRSQPTFLRDIIPTVLGAPKEPSVAPIIKGINFMIIVLSSYQAVNVCLSGECFWLWNHFNSTNWEQLAQQQVLCVVFTVIVKDLLIVGVLQCMVQCETYCCILCHHNTHGVIYAHPAIIGS